jgi:hypothetical protein
MYAPCSNQLYHPTLDPETIRKRCMVEDNCQRLLIPIKKRYINEDITVTS